MPDSSTCPACHRPWTVPHRLSCARRRRGRVEWMTWYVATSVRYAADRVGWLVRPYDQALDRRRWLWQRAGRCGLGGLSPEVRAQVVQAVHIEAVRRDAQG